MKKYRVELGFTNRYKHKIFVLNPVIVIHFDRQIEIDISFLFWGFGINISKKQLKTK